MKRLIALGVIVIVIALLLFLIYLDRKEEYEPQPDLNVNSEFVKIGDSEGLITVDIVRSPEEWIKGLMYVEELGVDEGMLFWGEQDIRHGFWMKNTLIPLDMIFISSDMVIVDINRSAQPCDDLGPCPTYTPPFTYRHVLEVNGGYTDLNDIKVGDKVELLPSVGL